jgi:hypothetical protein
MNHNLAMLTDAERQRIEVDKARSFIAHQWLTKTPRHEIRQRLEGIENQEEREDMRRRLNEMRSLPRYAKTSR